MTSRMKPTRTFSGRIFPGAILMTVMTGCGGTALLKDPLPLDSVGPVVAASDGHLAVTVDSLIVRDGPGTWARNADWDEYRLTVHNLAETPVWLDRVFVVDTLDHAVDVGSSRKELVRQSKEVVRRHEDAGLDIKAGAGTSTLLTSGTVVSAVGLGTVSAAGTGALVSGGMASVGGAAAAASGMLLVGPALITSGIVRGVNNAKVNDRIESEHTELPILIPAAEKKHLNLFFPLIPSPQQLVLAFRDGDAVRQLVLDTSSALAGLHSAGEDPPN